MPQVQAPRAEALIILPSPSFPSPDVNYEELARCTDDFNGAQCKAVCVEAVSVLGSEPREGVGLVGLAVLPGQGRH